MIPFELLSAPALRVIDAARTAARQTGTRAALVGGAVRDLLLGIEVKDLDFTAEGDAGRFVDEIARLLAVKPHHHERFRTWRLSVPGLEPVDIVTARSETYARPGALPDVTPGTIEDDLARRDFPLNCIGWDIRDEVLIDPVHGLDDLRDRTLRILHPRSFIDDPTRLMRLFRLAARYGFIVESSTLQLAREAVRDGMLDRVSRERLRRELDVALDESAAGAVLSAFAEEGVIAALFPSAGAVEARRLDLAARLAREAGADRRTVLLAVLLGESACQGVEAFWGRTFGRSVCLASLDAGRTRRLAARTLDSCRLLAWSARTSREALAASLMELFLPLRAAWDAARLGAECLDGLSTEGAGRGRALRKGRLAMASGAADAAQAARIARTKALKYLETR